MRGPPRALLGLALIAALVMLLVLPGLLSPVAPGATVSRVAGAPRVAGRVVAAGAVAPLGPTPRAAGAHPGLGSKWTSSFFNDVNVTFTVPYVGGQTFLPAPFRNEIPMASDGFWMNLTSIRPLIYANLTIWGWSWPTNGYAQPLNAPYNPASPPYIQMYVNATKNTTASYYFDDYKSFWPGSRIDFNLTVTALGVSPATIYSTSAPSYSFVDPLNSSDYASWIAQIGGPFASPQFNSSVEITTTPDVLSSPAFDPNPTQPIQVMLTAIAPPGTAVGTIPAAILYYTYTQNNTSSNSAIAFTPLNGTTVQLATPLGPFPNAEVSFNITMWLPWFGGAIDREYSNEYTFNWSRNGGWWYPNQGLLANLELSTDPGILPPASGVVAPGTPVNVTLTEPIQNVTISSGQINYIFRDGLGTHSGTLPMRHVGRNVTYAVLPGLPPSSSVEFSVTAKDVFGNPVFTENYTYSAARALSMYPPDRGFFFFEVLDVAGTGLLPGFDYTLSNASFSESAQASSLGFGAPVVPHGLGYLILGFGTYSLAVTAFGRAYSTIVTVNNETPFTVIFYVASSSIPLGTETSLPVVTIGGVLGLVAAVGGVGVVWPWFRERRKRIEAEQRRITL